MLAMCILAYTNYLYVSLYLHCVHTVSLIWVYNYSFETA